MCLKAQDRSSTRPGKGLVGKGLERRLKGTGRLPLEDLCGACISVVGNEHRSDHALDSCMTPAFVMRSSKVFAPLCECWGAGGQQSDCAGWACLDAPRIGKTLVYPGCSARTALRGTRPAVPLFIQGSVGVRVRARVHVRVCDGARALSPCWEMQCSQSASRLADCNIVSYMHFNHRSNT